MAKATEAMGAMQAMKDMNAELPRASSFSSAYQVLQGQKRKELEEKLELKREGKRKLDDDGSDDGDDNDEGKTRETSTLSQAKPKRRKGKWLEAVAWARKFASENSIDIVENLQRGGALHSLAMQYMDWEA